MTISPANFLIPAAIFALAVTAFTRSTLADSQTRTTAPFHAISFEGSWAIDVTVGKESSIVIEGDKDVVARVRTEVVDGELQVKLDPRPWTLFGRHGVGDLAVHIIVPQLTAFSLKGSGDADIDGLNGGAVSFALSGSGDLTVTGNVDTAAVVVNGSGQADLSGLVSARASATINGSGDATVNPSEALAAVVNGSGQVTYVTEGVKVTSVVHGSGMVEKQ